MITYEPSWSVVAREDLADALYGRRPGPTSHYSLTPSAEQLGLDAIAIAFNADSLDAGSAPNLVVLDDRSRVEIFSWLKVNSPEIFPLSQYSRVVSASEWSLFNGRAVDSKSGFGRVDCWASVVAGEVIAQGDLDVDLNQVPLSRAAGCFSTAAARAFLAFGPGKLNVLCLNRLSLLEQDARFVRRHVNVRDLSPIWALMETAGLTVKDPEEAMDAVIDCVRLEKSSYLSLELLERARELHSDSVEARVIAFNGLVELLKRLPVDIRRGAACSAVLAVAAFLVGRGTTHEFLVRRNLEHFPFGPIWFGLLAGLVGSRCWDGVWARLTKGIERQLRSTFRWEESSGFDLCWAEYAWYSSAFDDKSYSQIPKLFPRVLSVEVVPGASCQLRLATTQPATPRESTSSKDVGNAIARPQRRDETLALLEQVVRLGAAAAENIKLLAKPASEPAPMDSPQKALFEKTPTRSRAKRTKGGTQ